MNKIHKEEEKKVDHLKKSNINDKEKPEKTVKVKEDKEKASKASKPKKQMSKTEPRIPPSAYYLFCSDKRAENKDKKFSIKELGELFRHLPEQEKENYKKKAKELIKAYEMDLSSFKEKSDEEEDKKENKKKKAKTSKADMKKNSMKVCNCGKCDECNKKKTNSDGSDEGEE